MQSQQGHTVCDVCYIQPVRDLYDALVMSHIRNECRTFMTRDQKFIHFWNQIWWFYNVYKSNQRNKKMAAYLFLDELSYPIGYGLLTETGSSTILSGGIKEGYRHQGYGRMMFEELIKMCDNKFIYIEVLASNTVAENLYMSLGFKAYNEDSGIIFMQRPTKITRARRRNK